MKTRIAAGQPPDVYYAHTSNMAYQNFATGGTALQIDDMIAKNKVDLSQWFPQGLALTPAAAPDDTALPVHL